MTSQNEHLPGATVEALTKALLPYVRPPQIFVLLHNGARIDGTTGL